MYKNFSLVVAGVALALTGLVTTSVDAQLSESQVTQYLGEDSVMGLHLDFESLMKFVDTDSEDFKYLLKNSQINLDDIKTIFCVMGHDAELPDNPNIYVGLDRFTAVVWQCNKVVAPETMLEAISGGSPDTYTKEELNGRPFYLGPQMEYSEMSSVFHPDELTYITGYPDRIEAISEGTPASGNGERILNVIDEEKHLSMALDIAELDDDATEQLMDVLNSSLGPMMLEDYVGDLKRANLQVQIDADKPLVATIELANEDAAEKIKSLIKTGLMMAPGGIDMARDSLEISEFFTEEMIENVESMLDVAEELLKNATVERDGKVVSFQIQKKGGYPEVLNLLVTMQATQFRMMEKMMSEFEIDPREIELVPEDDHDHDHDHEDDGDGTIK